MKNSPENKQQIFHLLKTHQNDIQSFGVFRLGLFGSFARNEQHNESDIDLVVEFNEGKKKYRNFVHLADYLELLLNRKIELVTWESLADFVKKEITKDIEYVGIND